MNLFAARLVALLAAICLTRDFAIERSKKILLSFGTVLLAGCTSMGGASLPVPRVSDVDVARYMGSWHIIAAVPLSLELGAYDPVETYSRNPDGSIATVFQFRKDGFKGELETKPTLASIAADSGNAVWGVKTVWPFKGQYVISHLEPDYSIALVGRDARDHVWILLRSANCPRGKLEEYKKMIASEGYDLSKLILFPQDGQMPWK